MNEFATRMTLGIVILILFLVSMIPTVAADNDSMKVIILVDKDQDYRIGDTVTVTVHVFDKAKHITADDVSVIIESSSLYGVDSRNILVTEKNTGIYQGTFVIRDKDVSKYDSVSIQATAEYAKKDDSHYRYLDL